MEKEMIEREQILSLDIGRGHTKSKFGKNPNERFKFITATYKLQESFTNDIVESVDTYLFNGSYYKVGDKAIHNSTNSRTFNYMLRNSQLFIFHAIKKAGFDTERPITIKLGLSIFDWHEKDKYLKSIETINIDNIVIKPSYSLYAQGQGVFLGYNDKEKYKGIVCIVDIGYYTFDFLVFEDGKPNGDLSYASTQGVHKIITELQTKLIKRFHFDMNEQHAKEVFDKGYITNFGETIDLTETINELKSYYTEMIFEELNAKRSDILRQAKHVIFAGGGAYFFDKDKLPANVVFSNKPYEYANVDGYYEATN